MASEADAHIVSVFLHERVDRDVIAGFLRARGFLEFSIPEFLQHFRFTNSICFAIEVRLKLAELVRGAANAA